MHRRFFIQKGLIMTVFPRVAILDGAPAADHLRPLTTSRGYNLAVVDEQPDVVVIEPGCPLDAVVAAVRAGVGVVVLVDQPAGPENRASDQVGSLLAEAGIELDTEPVAGNARSVRDETAAATDL